MEKCQACGAPMENGKCPYCGASSSSASQTDTANAAPQTVIINNMTSPNPSVDIARKNKWVAFFLCLFFGYLGIHNFYAGKVGMGFLYLFTFGLLGIGWIVDIIRILAGSYPDKWGRKLEG